MGLEHFDKVRKFSEILKVGLNCEVSDHDMEALSKLSDNKDIQFGLVKDNYEYDVIIGRGKIVSSTIYKMNLDQLSIQKIVSICLVIVSPNVWSVNVTQAVKPNAWYARAVGRSMFVYRDINDFLTEPMSGKKVWELDVRKRDNKYVHDVQLVKKIDLNSSEALLDVIKFMSEFGKFTMSYGLTVTRSKGLLTEKIDKWYTNDSKVAWSIAEKLRATKNCEIFVLSIIDNEDTTLMQNFDEEDTYMNSSGVFVFNGNMVMRLLVTYESKAFKGDITFELKSCTLGKLDDFSYIQSSVTKNDGMETSKKFLDLVSLCKLYPMQILQNCWLESTK